MADTEVYEEKDTFIDAEDQRLSDDHNGGQPWPR